VRAALPSVCPPDTGHHSSSEDALENDAEHLVCQTACERGLLVSASPPPASRGLRRGGLCPSAVLTRRCDDILHPCFRRSVHSSLSKRALKMSGERRAWLAVGDGQARPTSPAAGPRPERDGRPRQPQPGPAHGNALQHALQEQAGGGGAHLGELASSPGSLFGSVAASLLFYRVGFVAGLSLAAAILLFSQQVARP